MNNVITQSSETCITGIDEFKISGSGWVTTVGLAAVRITEEMARGMVGKTVTLVADPPPFPVGDWQEVRKRGLITKAEIGRYLDANLRLTIRDAIDNSHPR